MGDKSNIIPAEQAAETKAWALPSMEGSDATRINAEDPFKRIKQLNDRARSRAQQQQQDKSKGGSFFSAGELSPGVIKQRLEEKKSTQKKQLQAQLSNQKQQQKAKKKQTSLELEFEQARRLGYQKGLEKGSAEGLQQGLEQGKKQGKKSGEAKANQQVQEQFKGQLKTLQQLQDKLQNVASQLDEELLTANMQLVCQVLEQVLQANLAFDSKHIQSVIEQCLESLPVMAKKPMVYVGEADYALLKEQDYALLDTSTADANVLLVDKKLQPGDCKVQSGASLVSYSTSLHLQDFIKLLVSQPEA